MQKRKKTKNHSKSLVAEAVLKLPRPDTPPKSAYYSPLRNIIDGWKLHTLRGYLEEYRRELNVTQWNPECLDSFVGQPLRECVDEIITCCLSLGPLHDITRFLFSKYSCQRARFARKGACKIHLPLSRFLEQVNDDVLMMSFVAKLNTALDKTNSGGSNVYKSNVYYVRKDGLSVFSIDRCDLVQPTTEAQFSIVYLLDALPYFFISPFTMPVDVISYALQSALGLRLRVNSLRKDLPLHVVIKEEAKRAGLRRDAFPDHLKDLLHFQSNTLRQMIRRPDLTKYPSQHDCAFDKVSFQFTEGFEVSLKRRKHENIIESLYLLETRNQLRVPAGFVREIGSDSKNSFTAFDFAQISSKEKI